MAEIIVIRNTYGGLKYLNNALNYIGDNRALSVYGYGVNPYDSDMAYRQMMAVRKYYTKTSGNPLVHIVIAYANSVRDMNTAIMYGEKCAAYFNSGYQYMLCTHCCDDEYYSFHTHIIINSVSYINGKMFDSNYSEMNLFSNYVADVTGQITRIFFKNKAHYISYS